MFGGIADLLKGALWVGLGAGFAALAGSFAGGLHPVGDSLAVFRLPLSLCVMALAVLLALAGRRLALVAGLGALVAVAPVLVGTLVPPLTPAVMSSATSGRGITLYQKNLFYRMADPTLMIADVRIMDPDVLTLQEVSTLNRMVLEGVRDRLPSQLFCDFARVGGVALASRWSMVAGTARCPVVPGLAVGLAVMQVEGPKGPLWLASLHLHWPYPHAQAEQLRAVLPILEGLDGPVVLAGDFNMVPWSYALRQMAKATGSRRIGTPHSSFPRFHPWVRLPIDHVFAPGRGATQVRPLLGSDHYGLVARIELDAD